MIFYHRQMRKPLLGGLSQLLRDGAAARLPLFRGPVGFQLNASRGFAGSPPVHLLGWGPPQAPRSTIPPATAAASQNGLVKRDKLLPLCLQGSLDLFRS